MRFARSLALAFIALLSLAGTAPARAAETGFLFRSVSAAGRDYPYTLYVPRNYDSSRKWPVIVFLHGAGECGSDGAKQVAVGIGPAIMLAPDRWPFLVIFPQKPELRDPWEKHDEAVMAMVKRTLIDYSADLSRVYLTGLSQGGHGTWSIGAKHPEVWAAIAPVCGYGDPGEVASALKSMPIWCFHGDADTAVKVDQSKALCDAVRAAGGSPKLTIYPGVGHNSWDKAYRDEKLYDWLLSNHK